jgi:hypothetical protein
VEKQLAVNYKVCNRCEVSLPASDFPIKSSAKDGRYGFCKPCKRSADKKSRGKRANSLLPKPKVCSCCRELKGVEDYPKSKHKPDGLHNECKPCKNLRSRSSYEGNKDLILSRNKSWRDGNPDKVLERSKLYYLSNKSDFISRAAKRRSLKLEARPSWISKEQEQQIKDFYWLAKDLTAVSGETYHVDHIVPLQGKNVCGLHVPWNLQVLPADINLSKGNRYANDA